MRELLSRCLSSAGASEHGATSDEAFVTAATGSSWLQVMGDVAQLNNGKRHLDEMTQTTRDGMGEFTRLAKRAWLDRRLASGFAAREQGMGLVGDFGDGVRQYEDAPDFVVSSHLTGDTNGRGALGGLRQTLAAPSSEERAISWNSQERSAHAGVGGGGGPGCVAGVAGGSLPRPGQATRTVSGQKRDIEGAKGQFRALQQKKQQKRGMNVLAKAPAGTVAAAAAAASTDATSSATAGEGVGAAAGGTGAGAPRPTSKFEQQMAIAVKLSAGDRDRIARFEKGDFEAFGLQSGATVWEAVMHEHEALHEGEQKIVRVVIQLDYGKRKRKLLKRRIAIRRGSSGAGSPGAMSPCSSPGAMSPSY